MHKSIVCVVSVLSRATKVAFNKVEYNNITGGYNVR